MTKHLSTLRSIRLIRSISQRLPQLLIITGLTFVSLWGLHTYLYQRSLHFDQSLVAATILSEPIKPQNLPTHIFIPWKVDVDIDPSVYTGTTWTIPADKASFVTSSALPGEPGNVIIFGHNTRAVLGNIRAITGGETITLTLRDGTSRLYRVESTHQVSPTDTRFLKPTRTETLTLYTCAGFWDRDRFIVQATPITDLASTHPTN